MGVGVRLLAGQLGGFPRGLGGLVVYFQSRVLMAAFSPFFTLYPRRFHSGNVWMGSACPLARMASACSWV